uniref:Flavonoid 3',5'-hydroxylase n=1 Tax=Aegilops tauschii subsp. strangulata TaxID=200361 RepID=A0A453MP74_AEGTS
MQLAAVCTDPFVICCTFMCLLLHLALRSLNPNSASGRRLPPGPRGVPVLGALPLVGPAPHSGLLALARKYGPVMYLRMGTCGVVVASSPSAARTFLKALDQRFANRPAVASAEDMSYGCQNMVFANYGPKWKLLRKLSSVHLLGASAVAGWASVRRDEAGRALRAVLEAADAGRPVVVPEMLVCALANIVGQITVSKRVFDAQGDESNTYKEMIKSLLTGTGLFNISDFVPALSWLDLQGVQAKLRRIHIQFDGLVTKWLAEHAATAEDRLREGRLDFVDKLRAINDDEGGETITEVNIKGLITDMFTAGTDTSSIIVEWAMAEMIKSPSIMARAQEEMDRVIGRDRRLEESDIANLPYLQARFLSGPAAKIDPMGNNFELIPFGAGRRICAGMLAGMVFVQYFLGMLVHAFEWRLPDGEDKVDMAETFGLALPKTVPLKAVVKPRLVPAAYT